MKALHIIPSAFDYFDDIRVEAFDLVEKLNKLGCEADAITLQYGSSPSSRKIKKEIHRAAPSRIFSGIVKADDLIKEFNSYDIVHVHCPFFGAAESIERWKSDVGSRTPLVLTYYREVKVTDLFALVIKWYNSYHLPKLFKLAEAIVCPSIGEFRKSRMRRYLKDESKLFELDGSTNFSDGDLTPTLDEVKLSGAEAWAEKQMMLYRKLLGVFNPSSLA